MQYTLPIDGITKHKVALEVDGVFSKPILLVDGEPAKEGPKKNLYTLRTDDNMDIIAWVRRGVFDPSPVVNVDEQEIGIADPFTTWQWLWLFFPVVLLLLMGQLLGAAIGAWVMFFNGRILRTTKWSPNVRFMLTVVLIIAGLTLDFVAVTIFRHWIPLGPGK